MSEILQAEAKGAKAVADMALAKQIADTLTKHYPGHLWAVGIDHEQGVATIENVLLPGKWGFYVHLINIDPGMKRVIMAGGELLERFNVHRGRMNQEKMALIGEFTAPET